MIGSSQRWYDCVKATAATTKRSRTSASSIHHLLCIDTDLRTPLPVCDRRNLRRLDLASSAPEDVGVTDRDADRREVLVDGPLMRQHAILLRAMRDGHDVHVAKLGAALA